MVPRAAIRLLVATLVVAACTPAPAPTVTEVKKSPGGKRATTTGVAASATPAGSAATSLSVQAQGPAAALVTKYAARLLASSAAASPSPAGSASPAASATPAPSVSPSATASPTPAPSATATTQTYVLLAEVVLAPAASAGVTVVDPIGRNVGTRGLKTDAGGAATVPPLVTGAKLVFVNVDYVLEGRPILLMAAIARPTGAATANVDPASSLVAKKLDLLGKLQLVDLESFPPDLPAKLAAALTGKLSEEDCTAAGVLDQDGAARTLEALFAKDATLKPAFEAAAGTAKNLIQPLFNPVPRPTPKPTPSPTPTPVASTVPSTPEPDPTVTPTPFPTPIPTPKPVATPTPTPKPSATPTPAATATPTASPTATPTASPTPTPTPTPSPTPTPTPS